ncbi:MAG: hypothetical protein COA67_05740 [Lutibacter sp.]|nr:MAG: hypothetical protein COA67_05740 [Lutibacter sp.]
MLKKLLLLGLMITLNCNSQTNNLIGKTYVGEVGWMCIEMATDDCAGETYFLELTINEKMF